MKIDADVRRQTEIALSDLVVQACRSWPHIAAMVGTRAASDGIGRQKGTHSDPTAGAALRDDDEAAQWLSDFRAVDRALQALAARSHQLLGEPVQRCAGCMLPILDDEPVRIAHGDTWHTTCYTRAHRGRMQRPVA